MTVGKLADVAPRVKAGLGGLSRLLWWESDDVTAGSHHVLAAASPFSSPPQLMIHRPAQARTDDRASFLLRFQL